MATPINGGSSRPWHEGMDAKGIMLHVREVRKTDAIASSILPLAQGDRGLLENGHGTLWPPAILAEGEESLIEPAPKQADDSESASPDRDALSSVGSNDRLSVHSDRATPMERVRILTKGQVDFMPANEVDKAIQKLFPLDPHNPGTLKNREYQRLAREELDELKG